MTAQEIFDKAAVGLLTQKAKSYLVNPDGHESMVCAYRGANGKKCAAGFCIDDHTYIGTVRADDQLARPLRVFCRNNTCRSQ